MKEFCNTPIDFVLLWVDDQDPKWQQIRAEHAAIPVTRESAGIHRFRDWALLPYMFRAFERFTPWVNHIYLVTCGHYPAWLNQDHPKLTLVRHEEFMPAEYLPTFNANAIELNLHRIPGLSEHFVYFNDDTFPIRPLSEKCFFKHGLPRDIFIQTPSTYTSSRPLFSSILYNDLCMTARHFEKKEFLKRYPFKYLNPAYGTSMLWNLYMLPIQSLTGFRYLHSATALKRSTLEALWQSEGETLHNTSMHKFRTPEDVNQYVFSQHQIMSGQFAPINPKTRRGFTIGQNRDVYADVIRRQTADIICLNDEDVGDFDQEKQFLHTCFDAILPQKSAFELDR